MERCRSVVLQALPLFVVRDIVEHNPRIGLYLCPIKFIPFKAYEALYLLNILGGYS